MVHSDGIFYPTDHRNLDVLLKAKGKPFRVFEDPEWQMELGQWHQQEEFHRHGLLVADATNRLWQCLPHDCESGQLYGHHKEAPVTPLRVWTLPHSESRWLKGRDVEV